MQAFNEEIMQGKMNVDVVNKDGVPRSLILQVQEADCFDLLNEDTEIKNEPTDESITVKIKFYKAEDDQEGRTRVRFTRKFGDVVSWTRLFNKMRNEYLDDVLLLPREHMA